MVCCSFGCLGGLAFSYTKPSKHQKHFQIYFFLTCYCLLDRLCFIVTNPRIKINPCLSRKDVMLGLRQAVDRHWSLSGESTRARNQGTYLIEQLRSHLQLRARLLLLPTKQRYRYYGNNALPIFVRCYIGTRCDCQPHLHRGTTTGSQ